MECEHRRGFIFGMEFSLLPREIPDSVPFVVLRCTEEIENRALGVQVGVEQNINLVKMS